MSNNLSKTLSNNIELVAQNSSTEEDLKIGVQRLIDDALVKLGIKNSVKFEKKIYKSRRADVHLSCSGARI